MKESWAEREADLKFLQQTLHRNAKDQQNINMVNYNHMDHFSQMEMGTVGNDVHVEAHKKLNALMRIFPDRPQPISMEDPHGDKTRWSNEEIVQTEENLEAFMHPQRIVLGLLGGDKLVTNNQMRVVRENYPDMIKNLKLKLMSAFQHDNIKLSQNQKMKLSILMDMPVSHMMTGEAMYVAKFVHNKSMMRGHQNARQSRGMDMTAIQNMQTSMQRSQV